MESVLCLMKRQFKEGAERLSKILKKRNPLLKEYLAKCHAYRAYAYASLEMHEKACKDLSASYRIEKLDGASKYNLLVSKGILAA